MESPPPTMDAARFARLQEIFFAARDVEGDARIAVLDSACGDDVALRAEVESLLRHEAVDPFPSPPIKPLTSEAMPESIGSFRILERLGEGGMGTVYKAEQRSPVRRTVAIKLIKPGMGTREVLARFESERQALARMNHPHIARVLDAGADLLDRPYFVLEYVPGVSITKFADDNKLSIKQRLELFIQVCDAIAHAHSKAIIHRDIKANNVLAYQEAGKPIVKVIDFGVAKALTNDKLTDQTFNTARGQPIGTYESMSPEQADGSPDIDTRTDVYSLGVLLYELLSGSKPFDTKTLNEAGAAEIRRMIRDVDPPKPSTRLSNQSETGTKIAAARREQVDALAKQLRSELEWIPLMAMRKERDRRYASPLTLADDIRNYLDANPLMAGPDSVGYRVRKLLRRNKGPIVAVASVFLALVLGIGGTTLGLFRAARAKTEADRQKGLAVEQTQKAVEERILADRERDRSRKQAYFTCIASAGACIERGDMDNARRLLEEAPETERRWEWGYLQAQSDGSIAVLHGHRGLVGLAEFSRDGTRILTAAVGLFGVHDRTARIWDAVTGAEIAVLRGHEDELNSASFSPDGRHVVTSSKDKTARVWDATSGKELTVIRGHGDEVNSSRFSPDGHRIITASKDQTARIWDAKTGVQQEVFEGQTDEVKAARFSPDGKLIVTTADDGTAWIRNTASGEVVVLADDAYKIKMADFNRDGTQIATLCDDNTVRVFESYSGNIISELRGHTDDINWFDFSPDGKLIVSASDDKTARIWEAASGKGIGVLRGHGGGVHSAVFSQDGKQILTASADRTARVWEANSGKEVGVLRGHSGQVYSAEFSPDGTRIVTASFDKTARIWEASFEREIAIVLRGQTVFAVRSMFSPDGTRMVSLSNENCATILDSNTGEALAVLRGHEMPVITASFSPDGMKVVTASGDHTARVWETRSGKEIAILRGDEASVYLAVFSPDGGRIATGSDDGTVRLWKVNSAEGAQVLRGHDKGVWYLAFNADGTQLVTSSADGTARLWDLKSGRQITILHYEQTALDASDLNLLHPADFSPDGQKLVAATGTNSVPVLDAKTGKVLMLLRGHDAMVVGAAFSPLGKKIITVALDKTARVWDSDSGKELAVLKHEDFVGFAAFSPDGARIITTSFGTPARIWDAESGNQLAVVGGTGDDAPLFGAFSPDGRRVVTYARVNNTVRVWDSVSNASRYRAAGQRLVRRFVPTTLPTTSPITSPTPAPAIDPLDENRRKVQELETQLAASGAGEFDWDLHNQLRHWYGDIDTRKSMIYCDIILQHSILDSYMLTILAEWNDDRNQQAEALEKAAVQHSELRALAAACWIHAGELRDDPEASERCYHAALAIKGLDAKYRAVAEEHLEAIKKKTAQSPK